MANEIGHRADCDSLHQRGNRQDEGHDQDDPIPRLWLCQNGRRAGGSYELVEYRHSPAVAFLKGIPFRERSFRLFPGDRLFVYTDGVPEATNTVPELYGTGRMLEALNAAGEAAPEETLKALKVSILAFTGEAEQFDDITMLCLDYFGPEHPGASSQGG